MLRLGLVAGTSGNASVRLLSPEGRDLLAITPSQKPYASLSAQDVVVTDFEGEPVERGLVPSTETLIHAALYRARPDVNAVLHTHSVFASVAAVAGMEIPPILDEMVVKIGGAIQVAEYAFPGSEELAEKASRALGERSAVLLRSHGLVGVGRSLEEALGVCQLVERVAQVFVYASILGRVNLLPREVVETEQALFQMRRKAEGP